MTRDERGRFDRTRSRRFFEAIQLAEPIVHDMLRRLECVLRNEHTDEELKAAALGAYEKAGEIVTSVGLEIRHRALQYTVMNVPGRTAGLRITVALELGSRSSRESRT